MSVGTSNTTGRDCYVMTETIRDTPYGKRIALEARLKMVRPSDNNIKYLDYKFIEYSWPPYFENSQGYSGQIDEYETPIEWRMYHFIVV